MKHSLTILAGSALLLASSFASAQGTPIRPGYCYNRTGCNGLVIGFLYYNDCISRGGVSWKNWDTRQCTDLGRNLLSTKNSRSTSVSVALSK